MNEIKIVRTIILGRIKYHQQKMKEFSDEFPGNVCISKKRIAEYREHFIASKTLHNLYELIENTLDFIALWYVMEILIKGE